MKILLLILCAIAISCAPAPVEPVPVNVGFDIGVGHQVVVGEGSARILITFTRLLEEGRCAEGLECFWQGNASILLRLEKSGSVAMEATLNTTLDPRHVLFAGYDIQLSKLSPYPKYQQPVNPLAYVATLVITK